jgi:hypothetical protein
MVCFRYVIAYTLHISDKYNNNNNNNSVLLSLNPLNAELNPICHLLALLGAHHIFHVSRIRVKDVLELNS